MTATLEVRCPDIVCEGCANAIRQSLGGVGGVKTVEVVVKNMSVRVAYDSAQTSEESLRERLVRAGFPTR